MRRDTEFGRDSHMWVCIWEPEQHHFCTMNEKRSTSLASLSPRVFSLHPLVLKTTEVTIALYECGFRTCRQGTDTKITARDVVMANC